MKLFISFIFFIITGNVFSQATQLNELFQQYTMAFDNTTDFVLPQSPPLALQNSKELLVPYPFGDMLSVIKWKDIDSVRISDTRRGDIILELLGKVVSYTKCKYADKHAVKYYDTSYCRRKTDKRMRIILGSKTDSIRLSRSIKIRQQIKKLFGQLNNTRVAEYYLPPPPPNAQVEYDSVTNAIIYYLNYDETKKSLLFAKDLQYAKGISAVFGIDLKIYSFTFYLSNEAGLIGSWGNEGPLFSDEILKPLKGIQPGTVLTFDNVKVVDQKGTIRTIQGFGIIAQ